MVLKMINCLLFGLFVFSISCAHKEVVGDLRLKPYKLKDSIRLKMKQLKGSHNNQYYFKKVSTTFDKNEKTHNKHQELSFEVGNKYVKPKQGKVSYNSTGLSKMGTLALNDMGFPAVNEVITVSLNEKGDVIHSTKGSAASIWYVAPVSLPKEAVKAGETWIYRKTWMNPYLNVPLKLDIVSSLKGAFKNKKGEILVEIDISGNITMSLKKNKSIMYKNELLGSYIFNVSRGSIESSLVKGTERMIVSGTRIDSANCIESWYLGVETRGKSDFSKSRCN